MNRYYHSFAIGFNWWMIIAPVMMILAAVLVLLVVRSGKEMKNRFFYIVAGVFASIWTVLFIIESHSGVIQMFDNHNDATTSGAWSVLLGFPAMVFVGIIFGVILAESMKALYKYASCFAGNAAPKKNHKDMISRRQERKEFDSIIDELNKIIDENVDDDKQ